MTAPRVLLLEQLDAAAASAADVSLRARVLEHGGFTVSAAIMERRVDPTHLRPEGRSRRHGRLLVYRGVEELRADIARVHPDLVIVAAAKPGGGAVADHVPAALPVYWWPTGVHSTRSRPQVLPGRTVTLEFSERTSSSKARLDWDSAGLDGAVHDEGRGGRRRLALWDGDYLVVPTMLAGPAGASTLRAFAAVARGWDALDLVVLAHPQPEFAEMARALGVGTRVHFAGEAPRDAESVWLGDALGVILASEGPISAGLVLRALARGCPVLAPERCGVGPVVHHWLEEKGVARPRRKAESGDLAEALLRMLERGPEVEHEITRGQALAAKHDLEAFTPLMAGALRSYVRGRRAAA